MKCKMFTMKLASITVTLHSAKSDKYEWWKLTFFAKIDIYYTYILKKKLADFLKFLYHVKILPLITYLLCLSWFEIELLCHLSKLKHIWWTFIFHKFNC